MSGIHVKTVISVTLLLLMTHPVNDSAAHERPTAATPGINRNRIVTPADVYGEFNKISQLIDAMGFYMGISPPGPFGVKVSNVTPYDIYFQAVSVFNTANRLSFEIIRKRSKLPMEYPENIKPSDIMDLSVNTLKALERVADEFGLSVQYRESPMKMVTPKDVFQKIVNTKRYLNLLLEKRFLPSDVYQLVNLAIGYASRLLKHYQSPERIPGAQPFEAGKTPRDVFYRLNACRLVLSKIYEASGLEMLVFNLDGVDKTTITPADVFDLASLIVARLYFYNKIEGVGVLPGNTYYPGHKYPSHVYRQAGILLNQLDWVLSKIQEKKRP